MIILIIPRTNRSLLCIFLIKILHIISIDVICFQFRLSFKLLNLIHRLATRHFQLVDILTDGIFTERRQYYGQNTMREWSTKHYTEKTTWTPLKTRVALMSYKNPVTNHICGHKWYLRKGWYLIIANRANSW